jgi:hypothetical protein
MNGSETTLEEIRESRRRMSEQFGHDPAKFVEYLKSFSDRYSAQVARYRKDQPVGPDRDCAR